VENLAVLKYKVLRYWYLKSTCDHRLAKSQPLYCRPSRGDVSNNYIRYTWFTIEKKVGAGANPSPNRFIRAARAPVVMPLQNYPGLPASRHRHRKLRMSRRFHRHCRQLAHDIKAFENVTP
jgi:hypothetical protein